MKNHSNGEHVDRAVELSGAEEHLRSTVCHCHHRSLSSSVAHIPGKTEVPDSETVIGIQKQVVELDVEVDDLELVCESKYKDRVSRPITLGLK